ncbi:MAG: ankyrin repeat domain-containing protein [Litorimonas sp.]
MRIFQLLFVFSVLALQASEAFSDTCGDICRQDFWHTATTIEIKAAISKVNVKARNKDNWTPLHMAAAYGTTDDVKAMLDAGASVKARTIVGLTPLHLSGTEQKLNILLEAGADLNARDDSGRTPLLRAAKWGTHEYMSALIAAGAKTIIRDRDGSTPLHLAAKRDGSEGISVLLNAGAKVNARDNDGSTPLHLAFDNEDLNLALVRALLAAAADVNARNEVGFTPLHFAAMRGTEESINFLLNVGANGSAKSLKGNSPFYFAKDNNKIIDTDAYWKLRDASFEPDPEDIAEHLRLLGKLAVEHEVNERIFSACSELATRDAVSAYTNETCISSFKSNGLP